MATIKSSTQPAPPSSSSTHRLPTFSASQALQKLKANNTRTSISTSLPRLNALLGGGGIINSASNSFVVDNETKYLDDNDDNDGNADHGGDESGGTREQSEQGDCGGIRRGQLTEIYGPPGVGKTAFCMQLAANTIEAGDEAVWVDCSSPITSSRLMQIYRSGLNKDLSLASGNDKMKKNDDDDSSNKNRSSWKDRFHHLTAPTLAHLLALLLHPSRSTSPLSSSTFLPPRTALLVIDSISTVFDDVYRQDRGRNRRQQQQYYQIPQHSYASPSSNRNVHNSNITSRPISSHSQSRHLVLSDLITRLSSLAALHNVAVVYTSQTATRLVRYGSVNADGGANITGTSAAAVASTSSISLATVPTLCPVLGGGNNSNADWHASVAVRIVLFRDWVDGYVNSRKEHDDNDSHYDERLMISSASRSPGSDRQRERKQEQIEPTEDTEVKVQGQGPDYNDDNFSHQETANPSERNRETDEVELTKRTETTNTGDERPDDVKIGRGKIRVRIRDARFAALLKVRHIPLAEDAALRRAVCFDIEKDGGLTPVFTLSLPAATATDKISSKIIQSPPIASTTSKPDIPPTITTAARTAHIFTPASASASAPSKLVAASTESNTTTLLPKRPYAEIADSDDDEYEYDDDDVGLEHEDLLTYKDHEE